MRLAPRHVSEVVCDWREVAHGPCVDAPVAPLVAYRGQCEWMVPRIDQCALECRDAVGANGS